jgi:hypothetical protein
LAGYLSRVNENLSVLLVGARLDGLENGDAVT